MSRTAVVTGGASGIGAALARALVARGDSVVIADLDSTGASELAAELSQQGSGRARAEAVDVRDADGVRAVMEGAHRRDGRLDLVFNNAGIGIGGVVEDLPLSYWDRAIDVNLRGVVHGVVAAYPLMLRQGHGHIINTASVAGLVPTPLITPYAMTKHAVVGLSLSLRGEAAAHGVRVSVLCPGVVDTPILDRGNPADLPEVRGVDGREYVTKVGGAPCSADTLAADVLRGVERNRALIVSPRRARWAWRVYRAAPWLVEQVTSRNVAWARARYDLSPVAAVVADPDRGARPCPTRGRRRGRAYGAVAGCGPLQRHERPAVGDGAAGARRTTSSRRATGLRTAHRAVRRLAVPARGPGWCGRRPLAHLARFRKD